MRVFGIDWYLRLPARSIMRRPAAVPILLLDYLRNLWQSAAFNARSELKVFVLAVDVHRNVFRFRMNCHSYLLDRLVGGNSSNAEIDQAKTHS